MALERYDDATDIINPSFVLPDVREGEVSLSDLWFDLYLRIVKKELPDLSDDEAISLREERYPLPKQLDFRMAPMKKK
jgi:hypothetical protein